MNAKASTKSNKKTTNTSKKQSYNDNHSKNDNDNMAKFINNSRNSKNTENNTFFLGKKKINDSSTFRKEHDEDTVSKKKIFNIVKVPKFIKSSLLSKSKTETHSERKLMQNSLKSISHEILNFMRASKNIKGKNVFTFFKN